MTGFDSARSGSRVAEGQNRPEADRKPPPGSGTRLNTSVFSLGWACDPGTYLATSIVSNFGSLSGNGSPVPNAVVTELGRNGVAVQTTHSSSTTDAAGTFQVCVPLDTPITFQIQASGFPTTYIEEIDVTSDAGPSTLLEKGLQLIAAQEITALGSLLQSSGAPLDPSKGLILGAVLSISQTPPCNDAAGWSVGVAFLDGGTLSDGGSLPYNVAYLGKSDLPSVNATLTSSNGYAIVYNVDPAITEVAQLTAVNVDGGGPCPSENASEMVTGRVTVGVSTITFAPYFVP